MLGRLDEPVAPSEPAKMPEVQFGEVTLSGVPLWYFWTAAIFHPPASTLTGSALIGKLLAFSKGQIVSPGQDDALRDVKLAEGLLDLQIVGVQRAGTAVPFPAGLARILRVGIGEVL
jgi:hypothetical protein